MIAYLRAILLMLALILGMLTYAAGWLESSQVRTRAVNTGHWIFCIVVLALAGDIILAVIS